MDADPAFDDSAARVPTRVVIASAAAVWLCYYILTTIRGLVLGLGLQDELALRRVVVALAGVAVTLMVWPLLRLVDGRPLAARIAVALVAMLPAALLVALTNHVVMAGIEQRMVTKIETHGVTIRHDEAGNVLVDVPDMVPLPPLAPPPPPGKGTVKISKDLDSETTWRQLTDIALGRYFLLLAWAALYLALGYAEHARAAERREGEYRRAAKAAELRSLRYQVNPHFLFNTLNSLSALVMTGKLQAAETMIQTISTFYRRSLAGDPTADVPLAEEIRLQQLYLEVEGVRFPERLRVAIDLPPELANACVPGMLLQPLVENSVKYAVEPVARTVTIAIAAREEHGRVVVTVGDDGPGAATGSNGYGIGLRNVRERLAARFGDEAEVESGSAGTGYLTTIRLPLLRHGC